MSEAMNEQQAQGYFLHALHAEIQRVLPAKCHKSLDSWMENGTLSGWNPSNMGPTGVDVAWLTYQAVFTIEQLPFRELDPAIVLAARSPPGCRKMTPFRGQFEPGRPRLRRHPE